MTANNTTALLSIANLSLNLDGTPVLDDVSLDVNAGEIVGVVGPNGSGKTALLNCISGFHRPNKGQISFAGESVLGYRVSEIGSLGIARTFQKGVLFPALSVRENIYLGGGGFSLSALVMDCLKMSWMTRFENKLSRQVAEVVSLLNLDLDLDYAAQELSFGVARRVQLAMALVQKPKLLLLDLPFSGLSHPEILEVQEVLMRLRKNFNMAVLLVEHNLTLVKTICNRVVTLKDGQKSLE